MFSSNQGYDSLPNAKNAEPNKQKRPQRKFLFAFIGLLGLVSLIGALSSPSRDTNASHATMTASENDIAEVSRAVVSPHGSPCVGYANPGGGLVRGKRAFVTQVSANMVIDFKLLLKAYSQYWLNIFHIGSTGYERSPSVWVASGYRKQIHVAFNGGQPNFYNQAAINIDFPLNVEIEVRIEVSPENAKIFFNDVLKATLPLGKEDVKVRNGVPAFVSNPWAGQAAASLKDFWVCQSPLPPPPGCEVYANPSGTIVRGKKALNADVTENMDIFFRVDLKSYSPYWLNLFHIGMNNYVRSPSVWVHAGNVKQLHFTFNGGQPNFGLQTYANIDVALNTAYDVKIEVRGNAVKIFFNGVLKKAFTVKPENRKLNPGVPVFVSAPWAGPAKALLGALYICPKPNTPPPPPPPPPAAGCDKFPNPSGELVRGRKIFDTDVTKDMDIEFKLTLRSYSRYWLSILHVGANGVERSPGVWTRSNFAKQLHFSFNGQPTLANQDYVNVDIELNKEYLIKIEVRDTLAVMYFNGVAKAKLPIKAGNRKIRNNVPVYASAPWNWRANALVKDVSICDKTATPPPVPPPPTPTSCLTSANAGSAPLAKSRFLFATKTVSKMQVSLNVKITSFSQGWANVFHLGKNPWQRGPGIWTVPNNGNKLHIAFNGGQNNNFATQQYVNVDIALNTEYELVFNLDGNKVQILVNGQQRAAFNLNPANRFYEEKVPVFAGNPWMTVANGIVKDVKVCLFE